MFRTRGPSPVRSVVSYSSSRSFIETKDSPPGSPVSAASRRSWSSTLSKRLSTPEPVEVAQCPVAGCTKTIDMIIKSSSDPECVIGGHRGDIAIFARSFPQPGLNPVVTVDENSDVLELLMQFMHAQELPDCTDVKFETLLGLAYAAKKYAVFSAMVVCKLHFREPRYYEAHPIEVLYYAIQHKYLDIADTVAPLATVKELADVFNGCNGDLEFFAAWSLYRDAYRKETDRSAEYSTAVMQLRCHWGCGSNIGQSVLSACPWRALPPTRDAFQTAYNNSTCSNCRNYQDNCPHRDQALQLLDVIRGNQLRKLSTFLLVKVQTGDHVKFSLQVYPPVTIIFDLPLEDVAQLEPEPVPASSAGGAIMVAEPSKKKKGKQPKKQPM